MVGSSCAGKSTFSARLSKLTGIRHVPIDELNFRPGWVQLETSELRERLAIEAAAEKWIIDGNYSKARDLIWPRATDVFWLDYSFPVVFSRAVRRTIRRVITREEVCAGNRESFRNAFLSTESMIWWVLKSYNRRRKQISGLVTDPQYAAINFTRFATSSEAEQYLSKLASGVRNESGS